jgi:tripartite-type tricarboxylate transporter receptor subunit TctC
MIRSGTPPDILEKLSQNVVKAMQAPDVRDKLMQNGEIALGTLTEAGELYAKEYRTWPGVVKKAGIKPT